MPDTKTIRKSFKTKREQLTPDQRTASEKAAINLWQTQSQLTQAKRIGLFWAIRGELPTQRLIEHCLAAQQTVFLPRIDATREGHLLFGEYQHDTTMTPDRFGIPTPQFAPEAANEPTSFDIIVMPLVAADLQGNRVGMGAGYYDRTLATLKHPQRRDKHPLLVGWGYEWQVLQEPLTPTHWDIPLNGMITDAQVRWF